MDMMKNTFKSSSCVAVKFSSQKSEKNDCQSHLCQLGELNFSNYVQSTDISSWLFFIWEFWAEIQPGRNNNFETDCKEKFVAHNFPRRN